ncbi:polyprenol monophosphomannose synthase [Candidatus Omnitrophota bacterium]
MKSIVVIPTYNEKDNIKNVIKAIIKQKANIDILFVDDNSPDGTGRLAETLSKEYTCVHILHRERKEGLGRAYVDGFKWALNKGYEIIMQMDADLSHDPNAIPVFLEKIQDHDAVFGSRYLRGVRVCNWSFKRLLFSKFSNEFIRIMLRLDSTDTTTAFKCFKRNVLESINLDSLKGRQNAFLIELVHKVVKSGFKTTEIPFMFIERKKGESKAEFKVVIESLWVILRLMFFGKI